MANMSYCRFRNTLTDLKDCRDNLFDDLGDDEHSAREKLVKVCRDIVEQADEIPSEPSED
jgi:hypothetical protein